MGSTSNERLKLALKVLSSRYDRTVKVSDPEIETLKSYFRGDVAAMSLDDLAGAVIQQELNERMIEPDKAKGDSVKAASDQVADTSPTKGKRPCFRITILIVERNGVLQSQTGVPEQWRPPKSV
jgi:hypothetical protein